MIHTWWHWRHQHKDEAMDSKWRLLVIWTAWLGLTINSNDNKSIKTALFIIAIWGTKKRAENRSVGRNKLYHENGTTNDKIRVNECKNDKKRKIVFSFVIILCFLCGKKCRFLSFFWPHSVPQLKICPSIFNSKCLIINTF